MVALALDPGGTTGYTLSNGDVLLGGQLGPDIHRLELWTLLNNVAPAKVICERFDYEIRRDSQDMFDVPGIELISRNYIGVVELYCDLTDTPLYMQARQVLTIKWCSDDALKTLGIYTPGMPHQNDSARHMLYHTVVTERDTSILRKLKRSG
jgi:hypothetical protein